MSMRPRTSQSVNKRLSFNGSSTWPLKVNARLNQEITLMGALEQMVDFSQKESQR